MAYDPQNDLDDLLKARRKISDRIARLKRGERSSEDVFIGDGEQPLSEQELVQQLLLQSYEALNNNKVDIEQLCSIAEIEVPDL